MKKSLIIALTLTALILSNLSAASTDQMPRGVIVSKSEKKQAITVKNIDTGKRHTYFLNERTHVSSKGQEVAFDQLMTGQMILLDFVRTDLGREANFIRVPELDTIIDLEPIDASEDLFISGIVTGVRPVKRTVTIHGPRLTQRLTLHIPDSVVLTKDDEPLKLGRVKKGYSVEFRYQETRDGFIVVSGQVTAAAKSGLPKIGKL